MTERPFAETRAGGTVEITDEGWLHVYDKTGAMVAGIRPDGPLWCMIAERAQAQVRARLLGGK